MSSGSSPTSSRKIVPPLRLAELAGMLVGGAGEGALFVAEQDAFDEVVRDRAAVDRHERPRATVTGALYSAGDQFLADARFAFDQDGDLRGGGALAEADDALHAGRTGDDVAECQRAARGPFHPRHFALEGIELQRIFDRDLKAFRRRRFDDEIHRAGAHRRDNRVDPAVGGLHDYRDVAFLSLQFRQHRHSVHRRHGKVEDDQRDAFAFRAVEERERGLAAVGGQRGVALALHRRGQQPALDRIVVDDQNGLRHASDVPLRHNFGA